MKMIVLHDSYNNNPIVVRPEAINVLRKIFENNGDSEEEVAEVTVGNMCFIVKENIGEVILKIKKAESEGTA
jgi:hypothetical protein